MHRPKLNKDSMGVHEGQECTAVSSVTQEWQLSPPVCLIQASLRVWIQSLTSESQHAGLLTGVSHLPQRVLTPAQ